MRFAAVIVLVTLAIALCACGSGEYGELCGAKDNLCPMGEPLPQPAKGTV